VNIAFWVFVPSTNSATSIWTHSFNPTTINDATYCLQGANSIYNSNPAVPHLTVAGTPNNFLDAKIELVVKSFSVIVNDAAYQDVSNIGASTSSTTMWNDPNAINIWLGTQPSGENIGAWGTLGKYPNNWIQCTQSAFQTTVSTNPLIISDNIRTYSVQIAHEVFHILGVEHPTAYYGAPTNTPLPTKSSIQPTFGCCSNIEINDVFLETFFACANCGPQQNCNVPTDSDNLMCQASGCNKYLSPQQAAVAQYNLRTDLRSFLTASGYTAATVRNQAFDYNVTANEVWQDGDRYFKGNITVKFKQDINC
jgi:hypothetical protein